MGKLFFRQVELLCGGYATSEPVPAYLEDKWRGDAGRSAEARGANYFGSEQTKHVNGRTVLFGPGAGCGPSHVKPPATDSLHSRRPKATMKRCL